MNNRGTHNKVVPDTSTFKPIFTGAGCWGRGHGPLWPLSCLQRTQQFWFNSCTVIGEPRVGGVGGSGGRGCVRDARTPLSPFLFSFACIFRQKLCQIIGERPLFAFEFECNRPNGNSVTVCHRIAIRQISANLPNSNLVTNSHRIAIQLNTLNLLNDNSLTQTVPELPFGRLNSNSIANRA